MTNTSPRPPVARSLLRAFPIVLLLAAASLSGCGDDDPQAGAGGGNGNGGSGGAGGSGGDGIAVPTCSTDLAGQLELLRVPGLSAGIIKDGRLVCTAVAGLASIEDGRPVAPDTLFAWASVSKTVTATAAMVLFDDGKLDLDADIDTYLPFSTRNPSCPTVAITARQLLTHTSSIVDSDAYDASYTIGDSPIPLGDFVRGYVEPGGAYYDADENFDSECPGAVNDYSNVGAGLLGHLVEEIAGVPFDDFCKERIFTPLGMGETSFHLARLDVATVAMPYDGAPGAFTPHGHVGFPTFPDGLLRTSVPQMARFLAMMAQNGEYGGARILAEATVEEMRRLQIPALDDTQGLMWYYDDFGDRTDLFGHNGDDPGTASQIFYDSADGAGVLVVANGNWWNAADEEPEAEALFGLLLTEAGTY